MSKNDRRIKISTTTHGHNQKGKDKDKMLEIPSTGNRSGMVWRKPLNGDGDVAIAIIWISLQIADKFLFVPFQWLWGKRVGLLEITPKM